jgi:ParB-like chromosome segregation protein Spo0J
MTAVPIAELVEDMTIYPRHTVDEQYVASLVLALRAGTQLPPIVADKKSKRLVDGWHRLRAYRRVVGDTAAVDVDLRTYKSEAAILLDTIALNSTHGRKLDRVDQVRVVMLAERAGITAVQIASVLHIPTERVDTLRVRVATLPEGGNGQAVPGTNSVALKRPVAHLAGTMLTAEQAARLRSVPGTSYLLVARQLIDAVRHKLLNPSDAKLRESLIELREVLTTYLS